MLQSVAGCDSLKNGVILLQVLFLAFYGLNLVSDDILSLVPFLKCCQLLAYHRYEPIGTIQPTVN